MASDNRLLEMRQKRGLGAAELAADVGVSRQTMLVRLIVTSLAQLGSEEANDLQSSPS